VPQEKQTQMHRLPAAFCGWRTNYLLQDVVAPYLLLKAELLCYCAIPWINR
jgi:hypothetical protein